MRRTIRGRSIAFVSACVVALGASASAADAAPAKEASKPAPAAAVQARPDFSGYWAFDNWPAYKPVDERVMRTMEGEELPLLPWAKKLYDERIDLQRHDDAFPDTNTYCLPSGMPKILTGSAYPMQILHTERQLLMVFEVMNEFRYVYLDRGHDPDADLSWEGDSVGRWEGDTLVVDTVRLTDRTTIDKIGLPHTTALRVTEHIRLLNPDKLEEIVTIDDPKTFTRPWKVRYTYSRMPADTKISEYVCNENQRNMPTADGKSAIQLPR